MFRTLLALLLTGLLAADTAEVQGRKVHYTLQGSGRQTLVLIHGWTCDGGFWAANAAELAKRHRVLILDLPGHGSSGACAVCSMEEFADAVFAAMDAAKVPRAVLVGHSMGGAVMLACLRRQPERVQAVVGVDAAFLDAEAVGKMQNPGPRFAGPQGLQARERMVKSMFTPATPKAVQDQVLKAMLGTPESVAVGAMQSMFAPAFWKDDVFQIPFLQIAAGTSAWLTEEGLRKRFPKARLERIAGTGHFLMMEQPAAFNRILLDWVDGLKR
jgi:pimeloyl-ACP methyl ester carboxylesterase